MAEIQLLLEDEGNRRALASLIAERYTPISETALQDADMYIVDEASFPRYRDELEDRKTELAPVFCPVVLIRRDRSPVTVDLADPDPTERSLLINEVVNAPVDKQALFRRIANLLVRRRQTTELEEKNERLEQFTNTLRHELRNPLQVLKGYLDVAAETGDLESIDRCQSAVAQMDRLIEGTLLIVQGADGDVDLDRVSLPDICEDSWDGIPESRARLVIDTSKHISAEEDRLRQLFGNLFRNAVEHGGHDVTVTVGDLPEGFYVEDDGPGIPDTAREDVFEEGVTTEGAGSGVGLAVVKAVVDAHGWDVRIAEGSTGGARFEISGVE